jgi:6-phosphogluconolactonase (cycloisomerase 2 family)
MMLHVPGNPFGVVTTTEGHWAFVAQSAGEVAVVSTATQPRLVREIKLPMTARGLVAGEALTPGGRYLLVADGVGAAVISVQRAKQGLPDPVLGQLKAGSQNDLYAIDVISSPDGHFAFVSLEGAQALAVFNLRRALTTHFKKSAPVGRVPMNLGPVGMAVSSDGRWLYATSEIKRPSAPQDGGTLSVINLHRAERAPTQAVAARVTAGCGPVRVVVSPTGGVVWVAARESNSVLALSASKLRTDSHHARIADVRVGEAPVGLALLRHGKRLIVADSNRFGAAGKPGELSVINTTTALARKPAVLGAIPAGSFPRDMSMAARPSRLLVTNYDSNQLEVVGTNSIP